MLFFHPRQDGHHHDGVTIAETSRRLALEQAAAL